MTFATLPDDGRRADYALEVTETEMEAIMDVINNADGRKTEVQVAKEAVGIYD